jgi:cardiolipin synthase A/B
MAKKNTRDLIVMPDDGVQVVAQAIRDAKKSITVKMFLFSEKELLRALIEAHKRGVDIRVMLNPARRSGESENKESHEALAKAGVKVKDTNPAFDVSHEKSMVVDDSTAFIKSLNWAPKNFKETRDYAVITRDPDEVKEVLQGFDADWDRTEFVIGPKSRLIWCRGNARQRIAHFIDEAKHYLYLQNERYQDVTIIEHLIRARNRGVKVHLMTLPPHSLKEKKLLEGVGGLRLMEDSGIKIHKLKGLHLHAKMFLADGKRAIVGSMNIAPGSFDDRRELAIEVEDDHIVKRLEKTFDRDWENSHRLDLTDEGIAKDLEEHGRDDAGSVAFSSSSEE